MIQFTPQVGVPVVRNYADPSWLQEEEGSPSDESYFINIPHIHPGRDKYGSQDIALRRVLDYTMPMTFLVADHTMAFLDGYKGEKLSRRQQRERILNAVRTSLDSQSGRKSQQRFDQAKIDLAQWFSKDASRTITEDVRLILTDQGRVEGVKRVLSLHQGQSKSLDNL